MRFDMLRHTVCKFLIFSIFFSFLRFEICRKLGQGTYGKVQLGVNKETGQQVNEISIQYDFTTLSIIKGGYQNHQKIKDRN